MYTVWLFAFQSLYSAALVTRGSFRGQVFSFAIVGVSFTATSRFIARRSGAKVSIVCRTGSLSPYLEYIALANGRIGHGKALLYLEDVPCIDHGVQHPDKLSL